MRQSIVARLNRPRPLPQSLPRRRRRPADSGEAASDFGPLVEHREVEHLQVGDHHRVHRPDVMIEPIRYFRQQPAAQFELRVARDLVAHGRRHFQHFVVIGRMAILRPELRARHPALFSFEVLTAVIDPDVERLQEVRVVRACGCVEQLDEFRVNGIDERIVELQLGLQVG
ncbi:hypothetical protein X946_4356 [Burkholderia sp. ABCPW 111]|nr:hypothetical protein X946_4356 [Burkholderia sp. ABCPW 111]